jgi:hypothetical protein
VATEFSENHGKAALTIIAATVLAAVIVLPIVNTFFGAFLPQGSLRV